MSYKTELQSNNADLQSILDMILALGLVDNIPIITFYITNTEYQAEDGMTWGEWVDSKYNVDGFSKQQVSESMIIINSPNTGDCIHRNGLIVKGEDVIISGGSYSDISTN